MSELTGAKQLRLSQLLLQRVPLHSFLGLELVTMQPRVAMRVGGSLRAQGLAGSFHGGCVATLVDVVGALAAFRSDPRLLPVTQDLSVRFRRVDLAAALVAREASLDVTGANSRSVRVDVYDENEHPVAHAIVDLVMKEIASADAGSFVRLQRRGKQ